MGIEVPSQYSPLRKPHLDLHPRIIKVDSELFIFRSKQMPIKIKFYGSDGKTYDFVVKHGEDLRQDERTEQLFGIMNRKLEMDKNCHMQKLNIKTFNVTPMTVDFGLLSWIPNTMPYYKVLEQSFQRRSRSSLRTLLGKVAKQHEDFLKINANERLRDKDPLIYATAVGQLSRDQVPIQ